MNLNIIIIMWFSKLICFICKNVVIFKKYNVVDKCGSRVLYSLFMLQDFGQHETFPRILRTVLRSIFQKKMCGNFEVDIAHIREVFDFQKYNMNPTVTFNLRCWSIYEIKWNACEIFCVDPSIQIFPGFYVQCCKTYIKVYI